MIVNKLKWICSVLVIGLLTVGCSWAGDGRHYRSGKHGHGHHYVAPKHKVRHHAPPPARHITKRTSVTHVYNYPAPPPPVYVPVQPVNPTPPTYYGGTLFSAVIGSPGMAVGFTIAGR